MTGKAACRSRVRALDASRAADLGLDQGAQELLGVPPLRLRGDQQLGRQPAHRGHLQPTQPLVQVRRQWRRGRSRSRHLTPVQVHVRGGRRPATWSGRGQGHHQCLPGRSRHAVRVRWWPGSTGRHRHATARTRPHARVLRAAASVPCAAPRVRMLASSVLSLVTPAAGGTGEELLGDRTQGQELPLGRRLGTCSPTRRVGAWAVVVGVVDRLVSPGATSWCSAWISPVTGSITRSTRSRSSTKHRDDRPDQPVRDRVAGRPEPDAGELVDLPGDRRRDQPAAAATAAHRAAPASVVEPLGRDRVDLAVATAVDLLAPRRHAR